MLYAFITPSTFSTNSLWGKTNLVNETTEPASPSMTLYSLCFVGVVVCLNVERLENGWHGKQASKKSTVKGGGNAQFPFGWVMQFCPSSALTRGNNKGIKNTVMRTSEFTEERTIKYMAQAWTKEPHNIYFSVSIVHYKRVLLLYSLNLIVHMEALVRFGSCMISVRLDSTVKIEKAGVFGF